MIIIARASRAGEPTRVWLHIGKLIVEADVLPGGGYRLRFEV